MNEMIKAVIFDIGGVLVRTVDQSGRRKWERRLALPPGGAEAIVLNSEMGHSAQRGEITTTQLWQWVGEYLQLGDQLETFRHDFWRGDAVDAELVALIDMLRPNYQLGVISNASDSLVDTLRHYELLDRFDLIIGSAYEGVMKPDSAIYSTALRRIGRRADETIFIDDSPINITAAQSLGMKTILFTPNTNMREELAAHGLRLG